MKLVSSRQVTKLLCKAIKNKMPYSLTRLGDGEFMVLKYPKHVHKNKCVARINRWFDSRQLSEIQINAMRNNILVSYKNSDILGVPNEQERKRYPKWKYFSNICGKMGLLHKRQILFYFYHIKNLDYNKILNGQEIVYCITCRDINEKLRKAFKIKNIESFIIAPEKFAFRKSLRAEYNNWKGEPHYPNMYEKILQWLSNKNLAGKIVLVGAGGLAKIYCNYVKSHGGIGIDVGAMFDAWAGVYTRPYLKGVKKL